MVRLGSKVRDVITGYEGVAGGRSTYLNGCVHILVISSTLKDGEPKSEWFDEQRIETIEEDSFKPQPSEATAGGPTSTAPKQPAF